MPPIPRYGWPAFPMHLAVAVLGWGMLSPAPAAAACGDYVHILGNNAAQPSGDPGPPAAPCDGPGCGQRAPLAPPAPPGPTTTHTPIDAVLPAAAVADPPRSAAANLETASRPLVLSIGVFRPPRDNPLA